MAKRANASVRANGTEREELDLGDIIQELVSNGHRLNDIPNWPVSKLMFWYDKCAKRNMQSQCFETDMTSLAIMQAMGDKNATAARKKLNQEMESNGW